MKTIYDYVMLSCQWKKGKSEYLVQGYDGDTHKFGDMGLNGSVIALGQEGYRLKEWNRLGDFQALIFERARQIPD